MEQIGYSLVDTSGTEVWHVGDVKGQLSSPPDVVPLPNGDQVHCAAVGDTLAQWRFVERWLSDSPPSPWHASIGSAVSFDGSKIVVTTTYEATPSIVPQAVTPRQARLALLGAGLLDNVISAVNAADRATQINWTDASIFNRTDQLITTIGTSLNITPDQIDGLFRTASTL